VRRIRRRQRCASPARAGQALTAVAGAAPHFDRYETRPVRSRETTQFRDLRAILAGARQRAPALRAQLTGIDIAKLRSVADLGAIPVVREPDIARTRNDSSPLNGFVAARPGTLKRILSTGGSRFVPEGQAKDWWGGARALYAHGVRKHDLMINCLSREHLHDVSIVECAASAIGFAVIPAGGDRIERQIDAIEQLKPRFYCGTAATFQRLLDKIEERSAARPSVDRAVVLGAALPKRIRQAFADRGVAMRQTYTMPDIGALAYETETPQGELVDGMVVNEGYIVEIVRPGTGDQLRAGEVGELVVTRLNLDYPLLRFGTGAISAILPGPSPCGRTNLRIDHPRTADAAGRTAQA
jgi:phenylacetate-CoA ligase